MNSLLFTMTTLTLIGYGHVSPSTDFLKIMVMIYTIVGIPIMALFLANIGSLLAKMVTYIYSRCCCRCHPQIRGISFAVVTRACLCFPPGGVGSAGRSPRSRIPSP